MDAEIFSACWGQAIPQGVFYIVKENEKLRRTFKFRHHEDSVFLLGNGIGIGFDYAAWGGARALKAWAAGVRGVDCRNYLWQKQQVLQKLFQTGSRPRNVV